MGFVLGLVVGLVVGLLVGAADMARWKNPIKQIRMSGCIYEFGILILFFEAAAGCSKRSTFLRNFPLPLPPNLKKGVKLVPLNET